MPCREFQHKYALSDIHHNSLVETTNPRPQDFFKKYHYFVALYASMDVEKHEETLVYDSVNIFAAIGGNLGLFLGFSCLSIVFSGIDLLAKKFGKYIYK